MPLQINLQFTIYWVIYSDDTVKGNESPKNNLRITYKSPKNH